MAALPLPARKLSTKFHTKPDIALVVGRSPWWVPAAVAASEKRKQKQQKLSFAAALKDFLQHVSLHCYEKLVEPGRRFRERFLWLIFHIAAVIVLIVFLWNTRNNDGQLLATTIYDPLYSVEKVPFPVISICSLNRISNLSAMLYAEELNEMDPQQRGVNYFYEQIKMLGLNYNLAKDSYDFDRALEFQRFLDIYDRKDSELFYNTRRRMEMLTPNCSDILLECRIGGHEVDCQQEFLKTLTFRGLCCTFNYDGRYSVERDYKMRFFGKQMGLVLVLNASSKNDFYKSSTLDGFMAFVHSSKSFADPTSGRVMERFIETGLDSFLSVTPSMLDTVDEARLLRPAARKCLFDDEMPRIFGRDYSFNKCITRCRVRSILILCQCLMFIYPYTYLDVATDTVYCTLQHVECLRRYQFKWDNVITIRENVRGLEREMEDALYCPDCLPSCSETRYLLSLQNLPLNTYNLRNVAKTVYENNTELAVLHVFFAIPNTAYFLQILKDSWFEVFSNVGNICGIITGFSLIGICEIFFFLARQLYTALKDEFLSDRNRKIVSKEPFIILP